MSDDVNFPQPLDSDPEDVSWALSTAQAMWTRGDRVEAVRWVKRASDEASEQGDDDRAFALARAAADLKSVAGASMMPPPADVAPPPPPPPPPPQAVPAAASTTPIPGARPSSAPAPLPSPSNQPAARNRPASAAPPAMSAGGYPVPTAGTRPPPPKKPIPDFKRPPPRAASTPAPPVTASKPVTTSPAAVTPPTPPVDDRETVVPSDAPTRPNPGQMPAAARANPPSESEKPAVPAARAPMSTPTEVFALTPQQRDEGPPPTPRKVHLESTMKIVDVTPPAESSEDGPTQSFSDLDRHNGFPGEEHLDAPTRFIQVVQQEKALAARESGHAYLESHRVWIFHTDDGPRVVLAEGERPEDSVEAILVADATHDVATILRDN